MNTNKTGANAFSEKNFDTKLPDIGTSIFAVMSDLARKEGAVNLSQGFPDFPIDPELIDLVQHFMRKGYNQYAPMPGVPPLLKALSGKIEKFYGNTVHAQEEITVTAGATQAIFTAVQALIHPGDEVILFEPAYDSYVPSVKLAGGKPVFIFLKKPDFHIDWDEVSRRITPRTKMIILNSPNNPGGYVLGEEDIERLRQITRDTDIIILSDEVYEHIIFDGLPHLSLLKYPDLYLRSIVIFSFGKTFHATGWKTGYAVAPPNLTKAFRKVHQFNVFSVNTPVQYALAEYLKNPVHYESLPGFYQAKRDRFIEGIRGSRWKILPTNGTYFIVLDYSNI